MGTSSPVAPPHDVTGPVSEFEQARDHPELLDVLITVRTDSFSNSLGRRKSVALLPHSTSAVLLASTVALVACSSDNNTSSQGSMGGS